MERIACCLACGKQFLSDEALLAWLKGKSPNPISCPECGELVPALSWRSLRHGSDKKHGPKDLAKKPLSSDELEIFNASHA